MPEAEFQAGTTPTVLSSWTRVLVSALRERGIDADALLLEAGIDPGDIARPDERLPLPSTTRLWQLAVRETGDENLGLWVSRYSSQTTFHALGYAFMASSSLQQAMERVVRFNGMVSDAAEVTTERRGDYYLMSWKLVSDVQRPAEQAMEAVISSIIRASRRLYGAEFSPVAVQLMRAEPESEQLFRDFFRSEVIYGAREYRLEFRVEDLEKPLPWGNEDLARSNDRVVEEYLARLELGSVATRLRTLLTKELPSGVRSHDHYAAILGMSGRSLQRKLSAEGSSFNQVLNETRCDLAKSYLQAGQRHSLTEIAFLLGFSDTSSFSRAFHRWTGVAPSAYPH